MIENIIKAVGRRKTATARTHLYVSKNGDIIINGKPLNQYFKTPLLQEIVLSPIKATGKEGVFEISIKVSGGGVKSQAEAVRHSIARALLIFDTNLRKTLKTLGFLKRDPRKKERRKPGLRKARRAPQWRKR